MQSAMLQRMIDVVYVVIPPNVSAAMRDVCAGGYPMIF